MATTRTTSNRTANRTVLFDIDEDTVAAESRMALDRTMSSVGSGRSSHSSSRARAATASNSRPRSRRGVEKHRAKSVTNSSERRTAKDKKSERVPTIDDRGHVQFSSSLYKNAVNNANKSVRARGALPPGSARSRDPLEMKEPVLPPTETLDIPSDQDDSEYADEDEYQHENVHKDTFQDEYDARKHEYQKQFQQRKRTRSRARSRKQSIYSSWSYCGHSFPNAFLRLCTGVLIVPIVVCGLIFWPVMAAALLTTILLCVCIYEHAWLSFRIHTQLLATYQWYEGEEGPSIGEPADVDSSTRSNMSATCGYHDGDKLRFQGSFVSSGYTQSTTSVNTGTTTFIGSDVGEISILDDNEKDSFADPMADAEMRPKAPPAVCLLELETSRGILVGLANNLFCGNLVATRIVVAVLVTTIWSVISTMAFPLLPFPVSSTPSDLQEAPYYFWVVNLVATLSAFSCPTWPHAFSLLVQKSAFQVLLQNAFNCPLAANVECFDPPLTSMQTFVLGVMAVGMVRALTAQGPANLTVSLSLDLLGYAYISGPLGLLVTMVDPSDSNATWATIWLGMLGAMWVAQFAAYCCDAIMFRFQIRHMRLLPPRIVVTLDVEASLCAIAAGSLVLVFGGAVLDVPGGVLPKVLFSVASVLMARFGRLILSLLKKASGVRWSGRLMPGFGGALDGSHALLFTSIVFVKYYLYVMAQKTRLMDAGADGSGSGDSALWATVTFSTGLES